MASDGSALPGDALLASFRAVLRPLARLAVASGLPYARIDEVLRQVLVDAASVAHATLPPNRRVSRISTTTGLNRREVTRLTRPRDTGEETLPPSHATRLFLRWLSDKRFRASRNKVRRLPRLGPEPSFESLAREITRDVHPRSLLDELLRLGLARHDEAADEVELVVDAFVPRGDHARMLAFLGANVGDHLEAAVANVLGDGRQHFEQAIFADELSSESIQATRELVTRQWQALRNATVPALEALIQDDREAGRAQDQRIRIGLYTWTEAMAGSTPAPVPAADTNGAPRRGARRPSGNGAKDRPARTRRKEKQQ
jgi:hypothetical protein